jgi:hypothetical protein
MNNYFEKMLYLPFLRVRSRMNIKENVNRRGSSESVENVVGWYSGGNDVDCVWKFYDRKW